MGISYIGQLMSHTKGSGLTQIHASNAMIREISVGKYFDFPREVVNRGFYVMFCDLLTLISNSKVFIYRHNSFYCTLLHFADTAFFF